MSKLQKLTRTWLRWAADMEDKHGQPSAGGRMTEKLSEFLVEHKASEFGLAPVSKAMAIKMAVALERALKYYYDDKEVMQNVIDVHEADNTALRKRINDPGGAWADLERKLEIAEERVEGLWWNRMSNEDIAAELSATFDLGLDLTRDIAGWMLASQEEA